MYDETVLLQVNFFLSVSSSLSFSLSASLSHSLCSSNHTNALSCEHTCSKKYMVKGHDGSMLHDNNIPTCTCISERNPLFSCFSTYPHIPCFVFEIKTGLPKLTRSLTSISISPFVWLVKLTTDLESEAMAA